MWNLLLLSTIQSILLAAGQVVLKKALVIMPAFAWTRAYWGELLTNWWFAASGILFGSASLLWMYILKHFPLSMAYPMISLSYLFGMLAAVIFFHETVPMIRWIGVFLIMVGVSLVVYK
jgi:undecaprenyl phosphate-alpha-L-ara4N flippase subunit ArnE